MTTYARISMAITLSGRLGPFIILKKARINVTDKMTKVIFVASVRKFMSLFSSGDVVVMVLVIQASNPYRQTDFARRSEEHTSELQSRGHLVCRLLLEKKKASTLWAKSAKSDHS